MNHFSKKAIPSYMKKVLQLDDENFLFKHQNPKPINRMFYGKINFRF